MQKNPIHDTLTQFQRELQGKATLVAVSKTKPIEALEAAYQQGQRVFGENKVQELQIKQPLMPADTEWHMIGHLQRNKVKYIASYVSLIHGVDREKLLKEINKQGQKHERKIPCLLQVHIAQEETKFGFSPEEVTALFEEKWEERWPFVQLKGLMGMATLSPDQEQIRREFKGLKALFDELLARGIPFEVLSMGMSGDYKIAVEEGSTMVRIGSSIFGARN